MDTSPADWHSVGEGVKGGNELFCGDLDVGTGDCDLIVLAEEPEYGGLGGTGGQSNFPTVSENCVLLTSFTLSRLQLLKVGLTMLVYKHIDRHASITAHWVTTHHNTTDYVD